LSALLLALRNDVTVTGRRAGVSFQKLIADTKSRLLRQKDQDTSVLTSDRRQGIALWPRLRGSGTVVVRSAAALIGRSRRIKLRSWSGIVAATAAALLIITSGVLIWALKDVPWREIADGSLKPIVVLETANRTPLVRQGPYQGPYATFDQFPHVLTDAVLSIEDRRFMDHVGIDPQGIFRALFRNIQAGSVVQGGSTITQQLIKLQYLDSDRTLKRKIQELVIAFWLEWKLGKQEILSRYLNSAYLGAGATGMPAAARIYFNKDVRELDLPEAALLAGLLRAPSQWNPIVNREGARRRTEVVLNAMVENGKITPPEAEAAKAAFAKVNPTTPTPRSGSWFADWIAPQASEVAGSSPGSTTVRTTLVPRLQQIAEKVMVDALEKSGEAAGVSQAALVAMTPQGAVVAMVGGRDYRASQFNRAVTAMRQPGSTFKLFVFYAALKAGLTLSDRVLDAPLDINGWSPENSGGGYRGWVTLAEAFARSLNAASVALAQEVGLDSVIAAARELGINADLANTPSLALGTSEVNLLDLTAAYASVRLGKAPVEPWGILDFKAAGESEAFRVGQQNPQTVDLSPYQSDLLGLLQLVVEKGTGRAADPGVFAAGKTGTSQNNRDAWFIGFTEPLVVGVWVGNDDDAPMKGVTGGAMPARIWRDFMQQALNDPAPETTSDSAIAGGENTSRSCNISACSRSYRSFRPSDCTYQPYSGERRICER
jgi:1A family penicillin-binding protein